MGSKWLETKGSPWKPLLLLQNCIKGTAARETYSNCSARSTTFNTFQHNPQTRRKMSKGFPKLGSPATCANREAGASLDLNRCPEHIDYPREDLILAGLHSNLQHRCTSRGLRHQLSPALSPWLLPRHTLS